MTLKVTRDDVDYWRAFKDSLMESLEYEITNRPKSRSAGLARGVINCLKDIFDNPKALAALIKATKK